MRKERRSIDPQSALVLAVLSHPHMRFVPLASTVATARTALIRARSQYARVLVGTPKWTFLVQSISHGRIVPSNTLLIHETPKSVSAEATDRALLFHWAGRAHPVSTTPASPARKASQLCRCCCAADAKPYS